MEEYNQIYEALEKEVMELSYSITLNENQKSVYSPKIADLVLRSASLLESILKYKYEKLNKDTKPKRLKYDDERVITDLKLQDQFVYVYWVLFKF